MANTLHQVVISVFRDDPQLAFDLLRSVFAIDLPPLTRASDRSGELDRFLPCFGDTGALRVDLALSAAPREPNLGGFEGVAVALEVQSYISRVKRFRMWVYQALLAERLGLPTALMLIALTDEVGRWARRLGQKEIPPRDCLLVLDRQKMPRVARIQDARARPALAMLSAAIHAAGNDLECMQVALSAALELEDSRRWRYASAIVIVSDPASFESIRSKLDMEKQYRLTQLELNSWAFHQGVEKGRLEGLRRLVFTVLELCGVPLDPHSEQRIRSCSDPERLEQWSERARLVRAASELFGT